jgi:hypothetical protein
VDATRVEGGRGVARGYGLFGPAEAAQQIGARVA